MSRPPARHPMPSPIRRRLLQAMVASGIVGFAERNRALAQAAPDYRALVGVFMQGGNDGENMLIRYDTAGYQRYNAVRPPASERMNSWSERSSSANRMRRLLCEAKAKPPSE